LFPTLSPEHKRIQIPSVTKVFHSLRTDRKE
jgi:hypothetical protein